MDIHSEMIIPCFARNILLIGDIPEEIANNGHRGLEKIGRIPLTAHLPDQNAFDSDIQCILVAMPGVIPEKIDALLKKAGQWEQDPVQMVFFFTERFAPSQEAQIESLLTSRGWIIYHSGSTALSGGQWPKFTVIAVKSGYNPVARARQEAKAGRPDCSISILDAIPETLLNDTGLVAGLALERQRYYLLWQQSINRKSGSLPENRAGLWAKPAIQARPDHDESLLHLGLVRGEGYGWGVCSNYLIRELSRRRPVKVLSEQDGSASNGNLRGPLFQALTNVDFDPMFPRARGKYNIGYTFFENELTPKSVENAKKYDLILAGSSWCRDRMLEKGIQNCDVLIQGIDPNMFHPIQPKVADDRFVIFSGGKFELRKGQDLVLRAVKIMQDRYPDVWLVNCWFNLWPASTRLMTYSGHIQFRHHEGEAWSQTMHRTYVENGLDPSRMITHELIPQSEQLELFSKTDIGVFPNRCEGGTNLVLMEYMACARPVIASNTSGHKDIITSDNALTLNTLSGFSVKDGSGQLIARWEEPALDELVAKLDFAYHNRSVIQEVGKRAGSDLMRFSWSQSADNLNGFIDGANDF